MPAFSVLYF